MPEIMSFDFSRKERGLWRIANEMTVLRQYNGLIPLSTIKVMKTELNDT